MRISDWSSDVCSSDLGSRVDRVQRGDPGAAGCAAAVTQQVGGDLEDESVRVLDPVRPAGTDQADEDVLGQVLGLGAVLDAAQEEPQQGFAEFGVQLLGQVGPGIGGGVDRKSDVEGKSGSVRVDLGGGRIFK